MEGFEHILLFKTSCTQESDRQVVQDLMEKQLNAGDWNLDQDDCDCVLRIVSHELKQDQVIQLMKNNGYDCCELI
jgi:hypothetical protein